jgi:protein gp37
MLALEAITLDASLQPRLALDEATVEDYALRMQAGDAFPPVQVFDTGQALLLADGFHRVAAARKAGYAEVRATVRTGTWQDAFDYSLSANRTHGLRRTRADLQALITRALKTPAWVERADGWLAQEIGCDNETVRRRRDELEATCEIRKFDSLLGQDGKRRPRESKRAAFVVADAYTVEAWEPLAARERAAVLKTKPEGQMNRQDVPEEDKEESGNIEWAKWSWNPLVGCKHDCPYCYARDIAERFAGQPGFPNGFAPTLLPKRLRIPVAAHPPSKADQDVSYRNVFTCSMADLFGRWGPREWIEAVLQTVADAPQWNFLFLTKFPRRMAEFEFPDNAWVGTSVDCQARVRNAEAAFAKVRAKVRWLSCEPLIEPLVFERMDLFQWLVIGGASRSTQTPEWRPPRAWVDALHAQASAAGTMVYEKTNLLRRWRAYPGHPDDAPKCAPQPMIYLGRKADANQTPERDE